MIVPPMPPGMPPDSGKPKVYLEMVKEQDVKLAKRLETDFRYFAARCLWIVDKGGNLIRFKFNDAQEYFHSEVEKMLAEKGLVRMIVLKGRQQGLSTYIIGRLFWIAITRETKSICILSHDDDSVARLFEKVEIFNNELPEQARPKSEEDNKYALRFANKSKFFVLTAGSGNKGRGSTTQFRHESERAFFKKPKEINAGVGQSTADLPGTEIYRESTANGYNHFQKEYTNARARLGKYRAVFIPWYWQSEYASEPVQPFIRTQTEERLVSIYGLTDAQLQWRRDKIKDDLDDDEKEFKKEYPMNDVEAFQMTGESHFDTEEVMACRKSKIVGKGIPILSCDPAGAGDRTIIALRYGRQFVKIWKYKNMKDPRLIGILAQLIDEFRVVKCFIDAGYGHGVIDGLHKLEYNRIVVGVHFGKAAIDADRYANKRAEMYFNLRKWMRQEGGARIPDDDDISQDMAAIPEAEAHTGRFQFMDKKKIKKEYGRSPDIVDALALSFAFPVKEHDVDHAKDKHAAINSRNNSQVTAFATYRNRPGQNRGPSRRFGNRPWQIAA